VNTPNNSFLIFTRDQLARQAIESLLAKRLHLSFEIESGKLSSERIRKSRFTHILLDQDGILLSDVKFISAVSQVKESQSNPDVWWFNADNRTLVKEDIIIPLTRTESLMIKQMVLSERRVLSKNDLILCIDKDPEQYIGLEMCLSRLQKKFKTAANGERLVRSVRNHGYCLAQRIKVAH
jgi:DNA-binding response OmpR family regulator